MQITLGLPEPRAFSSLPRLKLVQAGIQRSQALRSRPPHIRMPITPAILQQMHTKWSPNAADPDVAMLWAAATVCFFGFFRAGEITVPSQTSFNPTRHLSWGDVAVDDTSNPKVLKIVLKFSKTDQLGKGAEVYLGRTGCTLCPVAASLAYMAVRGDQPGQFFRFRSGQALTKAKFVQEVRSVLRRAGLPCDEFAGHSFRIGAATAAAKAGLEDSMIQTLGRWSSAAFLTYIRTPRESLAGVSAVLANS